MSTGCRTSVSETASAQIVELKAARSFRSNVRFKDQILRYHLARENAMLLHPLSTYKHESAPLESMQYNIRSARELLSK
jgi:hypothetical protein